MSSLRKFRKLNRLSQFGMGHLLGGVSQVSISNWERKKKPFPMWARIILACFKRFTIKEINEIINEAYRNE